MPSQAPNLSQPPAPALPKLLESIRNKVQQYLGQGKVAQYIPALGKIDPRKFGMAVCTVDGVCTAVGDAHEAFSIQSISKVFTLTLALRSFPDELWSRCGREPSGSRFNSLVQLEHEQGVPRNPFINAGALVVADLLTTHGANARAHLLDFMRRLSGNAGVAFDSVVARSEADTGFRNAALANFMKSYGVIKGAVPQVLDTYFHQCALAMSCVDLAKAALFLANRGTQPGLVGEVLTPVQTRRVNALMLTCGLYDAVGEFAYDVGLPAKSGVGGGIVAVVPGRLSIAVWSPELGPEGNSVLGVAALQELVESTGWGIF